MSTSRIFGRAAPAAALALGLAGCSSDSVGGNQTATVLREIVSTVTGAGKDEGDGGGAPREQQIAQAVAAAEDPLALATRVDNGAWSFLIEIERNGPYHTYASPNRQTVIFRDGVVTGTRGLGGDLMSSDIGESLALIHARRAGTATRVMRFLDGENHTYAFTFSCDIAVGDTRELTSGAISTQVRQVTETCRDGEREISNIYMVASDGMVLASSQWLGPTTGDFSIRQLKR